jgi:hypothetical protein
MEIETWRHGDMDMEKQKTKAQVIFPYSVYRLLIVDAKLVVCLSVDK